MAYLGIGRRSSYGTASWATPRLFPHQDPALSFNAPAPPQSPPPLVRPSSLPPLDPPLQAPPPIYYPGPAQLAQNRPGPLANAVPRSQTATIAWASHPTLRHGWRRFVRVGGWYRSLFRREAEKFETAWPKEFGGRRRSRRTGRDEEEGVEGTTRVSRSMLAGSVPDSGISLLERRASGTGPEEEGEEHPLVALFAARVGTVNEIVAKALVPTRVMLSLLEIFDVIFLLVLVVALGVEKGRQRGFLEGVEVALVLLILGNGTLVNSVRIKRWALTKELRTLARDWSPLPITTSTDQNLLNNALGEVDHEALADRLRGKDQPTLRWSMRGTEGSWWLSYRPVLKVELVTPTGSPYGRLVRRVPVPAIEMPDEPLVPPYSE